MPTFDPEDALGPWVAGVDEAGCGPWAGPVVAGAVLFDRSKVDLSSPFFKTLNDSKTLSKKKREFLYHHLMEENGHSVHVEMGVASVDEIDQLNIRQAALLAMQRAVKHLPIKPQGLVVDGLYCPPVNMPTRALVKGDSLSFSIAAASIIAKVTRDQFMETLAMEYPAYGWERNAGYGTKDHQKALEIHGITPHHRRSFAPIKRLLTAACATFLLLCSPVQAMDPPSDDESWIIRKKFSKPPKNRARTEKTRIGRPNFFETVRFGTLEEVQIAQASLRILEIRDSDGWTPVMVAMDANKRQIARQLIDRGANVHVQAPDKTTPLMIAADMNQRKLVALLLTKNVDIHATNDQGLTATHIVFFNKNKGIVKALVLKGADPNTRLGAVSLLDWAVERADVDFVRFLREKGAQDDVHQSALKHAKKMQYLDIATLINPDDPEVREENIWLNRVEALKQKGVLTPENITRIQTETFNNILCPITKDLIRFPVRATFIDAQGVERVTDAYEKCAILEWVHDHGTDPLSRISILPTAYEPDWEITSQIKALMDTHAPL